MMQDKPGACRRPIIAVLVLASLCLRVGGLFSPIAGAHEFRQTHTALGTWEIREHGFSLLHPRQPLFGEPWEAPLEYPVFQTSAALVDWLAPWDDLELSLRLTGLLFFLLTAFFLFKLCRALFEDPDMALWTLAAFLLSPFSIYWSTAIMIDYASVCFCLGYLLYFLRFLRNGSWAGLALATSCGGLAYLTKITSVTLIALPIAVCALAYLYAAPTQNPKVERRILVLSVVLGIPLFLGAAYVSWSDEIKAASPYTRWLMSSNLTDWNFGSLAQRLDPGNYLLILMPIGNRIVTPQLIPFLPLGALFVWRHLRVFATRGWNRAVALALLLSPAAAILTFFNLYTVHDYYIIAMTPIMAILVGTGLHAAFQLPRLRILIGLAALSVPLTHSLIYPTSGQLKHGTGPDRVDFLHEAREYIAEDEAVIVKNADWSAFVPYHLRRRAFMVNRPDTTLLALRSGFIKRDPFHWLIEEDIGEAFSGLLEDHWPHAYEYRIREGYSPYRLLRLNLGNDEIVEPIPMADDIDLIIGADVGLGESGQIEIRSTADDCQVSWSIDPQIDQTEYDGLLVGIRLDRTRRARFYLYDREGEDPRSISVLLLAHHPNRSFIPAKLLPGHGLGRFRIDPGNRTGEIAEVTDLSFVKLRSR